MSQAAIAAINGLMATMFMTCTELINVAVADEAPGAFRAAVPGILMFAADGWIAAGFYFVWQIALFLARAMPYEFRNTRIVTVSERQQVTVALDYNRLPPAALEGLSRDDDMPWRNPVLAARQLLRGPRVWRRPRQVIERGSEQFEVQLPFDVRH